MALRKMGARLVAEGLPQFLSKMQLANKSMLRFQGTTERIRTTAFRRSGLVNFLPPQFQRSLDNIIRSFSGVERGLDTIRSTTRGVNSVWNVLDSQMEHTSGTARSMGGLWKVLGAQVGEATGILDKQKTVWSTLDFQMKHAATTATDTGSVWRQLDGQLAGVTSSLTRMRVGLGALAAAFLFLGQQGGALPGVVQAFDYSARAAGTLSDVLLKDLRQAARGTISDMALMRTTNLALAGTQGELAKALGESGLAGLLEIARAQSRATGQSVNYLYESLLLGIKRTEPRLIDNTGLVLKVSEANEKYAAEVGKTVEQLTAQERQIALLNQTLQQGEQAVEAYGKGALLASERFQQIQVTISNVFDRLSLAVQPLYSALLAVGSTVVNIVTGALDGLVPIIYELAVAIGGPLLTAWERFTSTLSDLFAPVARLAHRWIVLLIGLIRAFGRAWEWLIDGIGRVLGFLPGVLRKGLLEPVARALDPTTFARGAGAAFGALGTGILWAFNNIIAPAIILVAEFIRDFLMGSSPPKKGPLHNIDKGGAATMLAWLEGFLGVSLVPVEEMAARVNQALGKIGTLTHEQVERRLAKLDDLLEPFIANLEIARAKMERITEPLRTVQNLLERKLDRALRKFFSGEITAEAVREIDRSMEGIEARIESAEQITEQAEIQLALAKSQQALQRALLEIQLRRTKALEKEKEAKEKKPTGKAEDELDELGGEIALPELGGDPIGDYLSGISDEEISSLFGELGVAFAEGVDLTPFNEQLEKARENTGRLEDAFDIDFSRFGEGGVFQPLVAAMDQIFGEGEGSLSAKIKGFADSFSDQMDVIQDKIGTLDPGKLDALYTALVVLIAPTVISGLWGLAASIVGLAASLVLLVVGNFVRTLDLIIAVAAQPVVSGIQKVSAAIIAMTVPKVVAGMETLGAAFGSLNAFLGSIGLSLSAFGLILLVIIGIANRWDEFKQNVNDLVNDLTSGDLLSALQNIAKIALNIPLGVAEAIANIAGISDNEFYSRLETSLTGIHAIASALVDQVDLGGWVDGIKGAFTEADREISEFLHNTWEPFGQVWDTLGSELDSSLTDLGQDIEDNLVRPFREKINDVIDFVTGSGPDSLKSVIEDVPKKISGWFGDIKSHVESSLLEPFRNVLIDVGNLLFGGGGRGSIDSLKSRVEAVPRNIAEWFGDMLGLVNTALFEPFSDVIGSVSDALFGGGGRDEQTSLKRLVEIVPESVVGWFGDMLGLLDEALIQPFVSTVEGVWSELFAPDDDKALMTFISSIPAKIEQIFRDFGTLLNRHIVEPIQKMVTDALGILQPLIDALEWVGLYDPNNPTPAPTTVGRQPNPPTLPPGQAGGGSLRARQPYIVGERGWELFRPNIGGRLFSHARSRAILNAMNRRSQMVLPSMPATGTRFITPRVTDNTRNTSYDNRQTSNTFNVRSQQSMRVALAQARAFK